MIVLSFSTLSTPLSFVFLLNSSTNPSKSFSIHAYAVLPVQSSLPLSCLCFLPVACTPVIFKVLVQVSLGQSTIIFNYYVVKIYLMNVVCLNVYDPNKFFFSSTYHDLPTVLSLCFPCPTHCNLLILIDLSLPSVAVVGTEAGGVHAQS